MITLDFLSRNGHWQCKTNQDLEARLKVTLKHANRPYFVSKSPICLLPPSFPPFLHHIQYFASSSSTGLMGMSRSQHLLWHCRAQGWAGTGATGYCSGTSYHGLAAPREQDARAPCSHPRALPTEWYVFHVCCSAPLCVERLPQSNQWGNLLGGRMGPVSNSQLDTSCLETALLFSTYLCPQLQPAKLSHFKQ